MSGIGAGGAWLIAALVLGIAELAAPGVFLVFLAIAAAITGVAMLALDLPLAAQLASFGLWSVVTVVVGRRWYLDYPISADAKLNDRAARMTGASVVVADAITDGRGRVRFGDGEWPATGPESPVGATLRIVAVRDGVIEVGHEPPAG